MTPDMSYVTADFASKVRTGIASYLGVNAAAATPPGVFSGQMGNGLPKRPSA